MMQEFVSSDVVAWFKSLPLINILLTLMLLDILSGVATSIEKQTLSSSVSWLGMNKKAITLLVVITAAVLEGLTDKQVPLAKIVAGFYSVTEAISILENAAAVGVPIPKVLIDAMVKLKQHTLDKAENLQQLQNSPKPNDENPR